MRAARRQHQWHARAPARTFGGFPARFRVPVCGRGVARGSMRPRLHTQGRTQPHSHTHTCHLVTTFVLFAATLRSPVCITLLALENGFGPPLQGISTCGVSSATLRVTAAAAACVPHGVLHGRWSVFASSTQRGQFLRPCARFRIRLAHPPHLAAAPRSAISVCSPHRARVSATVDKGKHDATHAGILTSTGFSIFSRNRR